MKKGLVLILFLTMSLASFAQQEPVANNETELVERLTVEKSVAKKATMSAKAKAKFLKINRKQNVEIISIKAYRKSLQIKTKTVKLC